MITSPSANKDSSSADSRRSSMRSIRYSLPCAVGSPRVAVASAVIVDVAEICALARMFFGFLNNRALMRWPAFQTLFLKFFHARAERCRCFLSRERARTATAFSESATERTFAREVALRLIPHTTSAQPAALSASPVQLMVVMPTIYPSPQSGDGVLRGCQRAKITRGTESAVTRISRRHGIGRAEGWTRSLRVAPGGSPRRPAEVQVRGLDSGRIFVPIPTVLSWMMAGCSDGLDSDQGRLTHGDS